MQESRVCFHSLPTGGCCSTGLLPIPNFQQRKFKLYKLCLWWHRWPFLLTFGADGITTKSTLSFLSDSDYQNNILPDYCRCKQHCRYLFVEKKIEIWHSMLRAHTQSHDNSSNIERVAKTIASTGFLTTFCGAFVPDYMRGNQILTSGRLRANQQNLSYNCFQK